jgi:hypothetical protein
MAKPWFMFTKGNNDRLFEDEGFSVPFGHTEFDTKLGGSHDLDIPAPLNYLVTALLPGTIVDLSDPPWGKQVGIELRQAYKQPDVLYMAYLHLSAIHPDLHMNQKIEKGDPIGWVGGPNDTSSFNQVGVALMKGPVYGGTSFNKWPPFGPTPIEHELDPSQIIYDARRDYLKGIDLTNPAVARFFRDLGNDVWKCNQTGFVVGHGILNFYRHFGGDGLNGLTYLGLPLSNEIGIAGHAGVVKQVFERAIVAWDPNHQVDSPPGAGKAYLMHLPN